MERESTLCFHSPIILSNCLAFFSIELFKICAWSVWAAMCSSSADSLTLALSTWASLAFNCSIVPEASVRRAWSFILAISSSSALARPSLSYFCLHMSDSWQALFTCLIKLSLAEDSSSKCSLRPSSSCSKFLNFPKRDCLSLASLSATFLTSSSCDCNWSLYFAIILAEFSSSCRCLRRSAFSAASLRLEFSKSPSVRLASSTFLLSSFNWPIKFLLDFSTDAFDLLISSVAARTSWISCEIWVLSFSIFAFILESWSICSAISATASWCFLFKFMRVDSCWMWASSKSFLSFCTSASLFLLSSIWAEVAPPASLSLSPSCSNSLARSERCLSALALACLSASNSSSNSSTRAWVSLMAFWTLATRDCSSSSLLPKVVISFSLLAIAFSSSFLLLSSSAMVSWVTFKSPSIFLLCFSMSARCLFSLPRESSNSSKVCSNLDLILLRCSTFSSAAWRSSDALALFSFICFFSLLSLLMTSSWFAISSLRCLMVWSLLVFSCSSFWIAISRSSISFLMISFCCSKDLLSCTACCLSCSKITKFSPACWRRTSKSAFWAEALACLSVYSPRFPCSLSSWAMRAFFSSLIVSFSCNNLSLVSSWSL